MPRLWSPVPNRDCILCAAPYHYSHSFTSPTIILGNKPSVVESRYNFPKVKQFAIRMLISKGERCLMTAELLTVNSQLSRTRLLHFHVNSPLLWAPFHCFIAHPTAITSLADRMMGCGFLAILLRVRLRDSWNLSLNLQLWFWHFSFTHFPANAVFI